MLWKKEYSIGVEEIDIQHKELFRIVSEFLNILTKYGEKDEHIAKTEETLEFMKNYVVEHFESEEKLQIKIGYPEYASHKLLHDRMVKLVLNFEEQYNSQTNKERLIKEFAGTLLAWLVNHVVVADREIADYVREENYDEISDIGIDLPVIAVKSVFDAMFKIENNLEEISENDFIENDNDIAFEFEISGDAEGNVVLFYTNDIALHLIKNLTMMETNKIDELGMAALLEISNIIATNIEIKLKKLDRPCEVVNLRQVEEYNVEEENSVKCFLSHTKYGEFKVMSTIL